MITRFLGTAYQSPRWRKIMNPNAATVIGNSTAALLIAAVIAGLLRAQKVFPDRHAGIDLRDISAREEIRKIELALQKRAYLLAPRGLDIADIGESLCSQQLLGHIFGSDADAAVIHKSHGRRFEGPLRRCRRATRPAPPAIERVVRKWRRVCTIVIPNPPSALTPSARV